MKRAVNFFAWFFLITTLLTSLAVLYWDHHQTKMALVETEIRLDNAELQRDIYKQKLEKEQR